MKIAYSNPDKAQGFDGPSLRPGMQTELRRRDKAVSEGVVFLGVAGDACVVAAALIFGYRLCFYLGSFGWGATFHPVFVTEDSALDLSFGVFTVLACFGYQGIYRRDMLLHPREVARRIIRGSGGWLLFFAGFALIYRPAAAIPREFVAVAVFSVVAATLLWRCIYHRLLNSRAVVCHLRQRVAIVGWTPETHRLVSQVWKHQTDPYEIVGYVEVDAESAYRTTELPTIPLLGGFNELPRIFAAEHVDIALLADINADADTILELVTLCEKELVQFKIIPSFFPIFVSGLHLEMVRGTPLLGIERLPLNRFHNRLLKRLFDVGGGLVGLALSVPIVLVFGALVYLESPGPIFYRQRRLGRKGKPFEMIKVRSMRLDAEKDGIVGWTTKDDTRRLKIGAFMRKWNIDEVPQFWNVLKGEMSLVGPRPERPELIADFKHEIAHYNARHFIKPGLTGWAQVNGLRGDTDLTERVRHDLHYIEHWNLWLDLRAMFLTFFKRQNAC